MSYAEIPQMNELNSTEKPEVENEFLEDEDGVSKLQGIVHLCGSMKLQEREGDQGDFQKIHTSSRSEKVSVKPTKPKQCETSF